MIKKEKEERCQTEIICIDEPVPRNHLLRKIDSVVDFKRICDFMEGLVLL